jgi:hypothetical protein
MERVAAGDCETVNPFNSRQVKRVSLLPMKEGMKPEDGVDLFVFWTRFPQNILDNADELTPRGFRYSVMVTVTGYPILLEPSMTRTTRVLLAMKELAQKIGPDRVIWRYDPILLRNITDGDFHRKNFYFLAQELAGSVRRVIISLYDEYTAAKKRLAALEKDYEFIQEANATEEGGKKKSGYTIIEKPSGFKMLDEGACGNIILALLTDFAKIAEAAGMEIQSCAEKEDYSAFGIKKGACIDAELINRLWGSLDLSGKDKNQRPDCLCCKSTDIGSYGICGAHCVYCYAWH